MEKSCKITTTELLRLHAIQIQVPTWVTLIDAHGNNINQKRLCITKEPPTEMQFPRRLDANNYVTGRHQ